jgi:predicted permease
MIEVLEGLTTIGIVVAVGYLVARAGLLPPPAPEALSRLVFFVATPGLLVKTLAGASIAVLMSDGLLVTSMTTTVSIALYAGLARLWWRRDVGTVVIGALGSSYVNAANLGVALAVYVFGDAALVAPVLLYQLVVLARIAFIACAALGIILTIVVYLFMRDRPNQHSWVNQAEVQLVEDGTDVKPSTGRAP